MIKVENIETFNWAAAIRGARNAMNSWNKSDSYFDKDGGYVLGPNDLSLVKNLYRASIDGDNHAHRKILRCIVVSMDIVCPVYVAAEVDTYKVGTTRQSCSFMHKGVSKPFEMKDFSMHGYVHNISVWTTVIDELNRLREEYLKTKDPVIFQEIRDLLPSGYEIRFTLTMNYENVVTMIKQRTGHRLKEWGDFVDVLKTLPYITEIMGE